MDHQRSLRAGKEIDRILHPGGDHSHDKMAFADLPFHFNMPFEGAYWLWPGRLLCAFMNDMLEPLEGELLASPQCV